jgi:hypothetical protein
VETASNLGHICSQKGAGNVQKKTKQRPKWFRKSNGLTRGEARAEKQLSNEQLRDVNETRNTLKY